MSSNSFPEDSSPYDFEELKEERSYTTHVAARRFYVFIEVFMLMLLNFLFLIMFQFLIQPSIEPLLLDNPYRGLIYYGVSLLAVILSTILSLVFVQLVFYKSKIPLREAKPPLKETPSLFTFKNFGTQLLFAMLILFLVYIPLDLLTYSLPNGLEFSKASLESTDPVADPVNLYLDFSSFGMFIIYSIVLHFMVGIREETYFRGFFANRADKYINRSSSVIISSIYFGMSHFTYLILNQNFWHNLPAAIVWSLGAFFVGSVSAVFLLKRRWIWPIIIAHTLNNIISSTVLWLFSTRGLNIWELAKMIYFPLLGVSVILCVIFFQEVKNGVKSYFDAFKTYKTTFSDRNLRAKVIIADIIFGILFWAVGMTFI